VGCGALRARSRASTLVSELIVICPLSGFDVDDDLARILRNLKADEMQGLADYCRACRVRFATVRLKNEARLATDGNRPAQSRLH
jgi:hypothetical protein